MLYRCYWKFAVFKRRTITWPSLYLLVKICENENVTAPWISLFYCAQQQNHPVNLQTSMDFAIVSCLPLNSLCNSLPIHS